VRATDLIRSSWTPRSRRVQRCTAADATLRARECHP
jgi:hypothetical protein